VTTLYIVGFALAAVGVALWLAKRLGRADARKDAAEKGVDHAKEANRIRDDVARLSDDELADELRGDK
jgi:hypothetical protein